eukprot:CAMPEP_0202716268 /NCGR_PEP_ID=MMETSP1385-20130828/99571_1 /ASSEMBLY_ACC=CAM_ASM_000861 /TAXON_ID=933848 /ORGANISM="Elphidium margaritaceum" /LENGTH=80 /DNA_ID=CAMNT_0049377939 /DNA_START=42 /DNA_END=281 /DNA_ORIENTATION=+
MHSFCVYREEVVGALVELEDEETQQYALKTPSDIKALKELLGKRAERFPPSMLAHLAITRSVERKDDFVIHLHCAMIGCN